MLYRLDGFCCSTAWRQKWHNFCAEVAASWHTASGDPWIPRHGESAHSKIQKSTMSWTSSFQHPWWTNKNIYRKMISIDPGCLYISKQDWAPQDQSFLFRNWLDWSNPPPRSRHLLIRAFQEPRTSTTKPQTTSSQCASCGASKKLITITTQCTKIIKMEGVNSMNCF